MADPDTTFLSYVPGALARRLAGPSEPTLSPETDACDGALLFADIAGFTTLAEQLAEAGPEGAERLTEVLNATFGELIDIVAGHGGEVLQFAGDAFLAVWTAARDAALGEAAGRAAAAGLGMQAAVSALGHGLQVRVGIATGRIDAAILGGTAGRWLYLAAGPGLEAAYRAGAAAAPGEVFLAPAAWALVSDRATGEPRPDGHTHLHAAPDAPAPPPAVPAVPAEVVRPFLPRTVLARLDAGQTEWLAEFRRATVLFANIDRLELRLPDAQDTTRQLQEIVYRYEGSVHQFTVDDKGMTLIAAWGLPHVSHEDDAVRAVEAARAIREALAARGLGTSIGITTGRIFSGRRGSDRRREYAILGAVVNLAARLMQAAGEGILCDEETARRAGERITFGRIAPLRIKGRAEPVPVFRPRVELRAAARPTAPVIGRARERGLLTGALDGLADDGPGGVVVLEGPAGIGKSSLIGFVREEARARGVACIHAEADALERLNAYYPWRQAFARLGFTREDVLARLADDPALTTWAPLLNQVVPLGIPENDVTRQMTGQARAGSIRELLVHLLAGEAARRRLLLILDDAHWFDTASWALALAVARRVRPLVLVLATRPVPDDPPPELAAVLARGDTIHVELDAMTTEDSAALLRDRLGARRVQPAIAAFVHERAAGNPFFSEQLAFALRDGGHVRIEGDTCRLADETTDLRRLDLPDTVEGVVTIRLDALSPREQLAVKVASTIGHTFRFRTLADVFPMPDERAALPDCLARLEQLDLTSVVARKPDLTYAFRHVITQDVAYHRMAFAQRRQLHRAVAEWYEHEEPDATESNLPLLAHHWTEAGAGRTAVDYLERAAAQALERYANDETVRFLTKALELADADVDAARRSRWEWWLGKAHLRLNRTEASRTHLLRSLRLLGRPLPRTRPGLAGSLAVQIVRQVAHRLAPRLFLDRTRRRRDALRQAADVHRERSEIAYHDHTPLMFLHASLSALNLAERTGFARIEAEAGGILALVAGIARAHPLARFYLRRAVAVGENARDLPATGLAHMTAALYLQGVANWDQAAYHAKRGAALFASVGDRLRGLHCAAIYQGVCVNAARLDELGDVAAPIYAAGARYNITQALAWALGSRLYGDIARDRVDPAVVVELEDVVGRGLDHSEQAFCHGILASAHLHAGATDAARAAADRTLQVLTEYPPTTCYTLPGISGMAEVYLSLWHDADARRDARRTLDILRRFSRVFPLGRARTLRLEGRSAWLAGRKARARRAWRRAIATAARHHQPLDEGWGRLELGRSLPAGSAERRAQLERAGALFDSVGAHGAAVSARAGR